MEFLCCSELFVVVVVWLGFPISVEVVVIAFEFQI